MKAYIGISQLLGARARAVPTPKVYAYDEVKSNGNLTTTLLHPIIPWGNEAEILIIAILGEKKLFAISGGKKFFWHFRGKEILVISLVHERLGDAFRGTVKCEIKMVIRNVGG